MQPVLFESLEPLLESRVLGRNVSLELDRARDPGSVERGGVDRDTVMLSWTGVAGDGWPGCGDVGREEDATEEAGSGDEGV